MALAYQLVQLTTLSSRCKRYYDASLKSEEEETTRDESSDPHLLDLLNEKDDLFNYKEKDLNKRYKTGEEASGSQAASDYFEKCKEVLGGNADSSALIDKNSYLYDPNQHGFNNLVDRVVNRNNVGGLELSAAVVSSVYLNTQGVLDGTDMVDYTSRVMTGGGIKTGKKNKAKTGNEESLAVILNKVRDGDDMLDFLTVNGAASEFVAKKGKKYIAATSKPDPHQTAVSTNADYLLNKGANVLCSRQINLDTILTELSSQILEPDYAEKRFLASAVVKQAVDVDDIDFTNSRLDIVINGMTEKLTGPRIGLMKSEIFTLCLPPRYRSCGRDLSPVLDVILNQLLGASVEEAFSVFDIVNFKRFVTAGTGHEILAVIESDLEAKLLQIEPLVKSFLQSKDKGEFVLPNQMDNACYFKAWKTLLIKRSCFVAYLELVRRAFPKTLGYLGVSYVDDPSTVNLHLKEKQIPIYCVRGVFYALVDKDSIFKGIDYKNLLHALYERLEK